MRKEYRKAYERAAKDLETAIAERKRIDGRIVSLRKTLNVLSGLLDDDKKWLANNLAVLGALGKESLTDDIGVAIAQTREPMTSTEIYHEVRKFSQAIQAHKNPLATINAVLKRLVKQGTVRETEKDGRKAWVAMPAIVFNDANDGLAPDFDALMQGLNASEAERKRELRGALSRVAAKLAEEKRRGDQGIEGERLRQESMRQAFDQDMKKKK